MFSNSWLLANIKEANKFKVIFHYGPIDEMKLLGVKSTKL